MDVSFGINIDVGNVAMNVFSEIDTKIKCGMDYDNRRAGTSFSH